MLSSGHQCLQSTTVGDWARPARARARARPCTAHSACTLSIACYAAMRELSSCAERWHAQPVSVVAGAGEAAQQAGSQAAPDTAHQHYTQYSTPAALLRPPRKPCMCPAVDMHSAVVEAHSLVAAGQGAPCRTPCDTVLVCLQQAMHAQLCAGVL